MRFLSKAAAIVMTGLLWVGPCVPAQAAQSVKRERVNLNLQNIKIEDFIKMVGKVTGENILLSQPIPGTVNFVSSAPIYKDELMEILLSVLSQKGFTIVENGSFFKVERANTAVKRNLPIGGSRHSLMMTKFIEAENENVDVIAAKVRQFLSEGGKLITIKESNTMIVSDYPKNINVIEQIVNRVDMLRAADTDVQFVRLENAKASRLAEQVTKISQNIINQKVENNKVQIISDDATSSIIVLASRANINKLVPIIKRMDAKDESTTDKLTIIPLENSEATNVVTSLQQVLDKKQYAKPTDKPIVSVYDELNAIVVSGRESDIKDIKEMVATLDVEKPQVFVKARIIEINQNLADTIGVKYGLAGGAVTDAGLFTFAANLGGPAVAFDGGGLLNLSSSSFDAGIAFGATVDFLASNGAANTLSEPTLLCVNNQESSIYVGRTEPIVTSTQQGTDTTSLARNTYTREDIGLTLKVKPRLSQGNKVTLNSTAKLEDILNSSVPGLPSTTKREVVTTAIVSNGESVIIGGLIYDKTREERQGIPGLRDIPLLGYLFDWKNKVHEEINLVIILTPFIVRHNEDMPKVRRMLQQLDEIQLKYKSLIEKKLEERKEELEESGELPETKGSGDGDPMSVVSPSKG